MGEQVPLKLTLFLSMYTSILVDFLSFGITICTWLFCTLQALDLSRLYFVELLVTHMNPAKRVTQGIASDILDFLLLCNEKTQPCSLRKSAMKPMPSLSVTL